MELPSLSFIGMHRTGIEVSISTFPLNLGSLYASGILSTVPSLKQVPTNPEVS